jgi:hypothetical protein
MGKHLWEHANPGRPTPKILRAMAWDPIHKIGSRTGSFLEARPSGKHAISSLFKDASINLTNNEVNTRIAPHRFFKNANERIEFFRERKAQLDFDLKNGKINQEQYNRELNAHKELGIQHIKNITG